MVDIPRKNGDMFLSCATVYQRIFPELNHPCWGSPHFRKPLNHHSKSIQSHDIPLNTYEITIIFPKSSISRQELFPINQPFWGPHFRKPPSIASRSVMSNHLGRHIAPGADLEIAAAGHVLETPWKSWKPWESHEELLGNSCTKSGTWQNLGESWNNIMDNSGKHMANSWKKWETHETILWENHEAHGKSWKKMEFMKHRGNIKIIGKTWKLCDNQSWSWDLSGIGPFSLWEHCEHPEEFTPTMKGGPFKLFI